jgi:HD-GYP domain-containing protein (c-di-GMP phosphodiesterase class II)
MPQIRVRNGSQKGAIIVIEGVAPFTIGRDVRAKLQIIDKGVSREHSEIFRVGEMVFVRDLNSRNGTYVNDERIEEELLREGDIIRLGTTEIVFESGTTEQRRGDELRYEDNDIFNTSLDLKVGDLLSFEGDLGTQQSDYFRALDRAVQIMQCERNESNILERIMDLILEVVPADHLYVFMRDLTNGTFAPCAFRQKGKGATIPVSRTILSRVLTESRAILTADAMRDERFKAGDSIVMGQIRAVLCTPIQADVSRIGAQGAFYAVNIHMTEAFEQADLHFLSTLGMQLAYALEKIREERRRDAVQMRIVGRLAALMEGASTHPGFAEKVADVAVAIAAEMKLAETEIRNLRLAALLHSVGVAQALSDKPALYRPADEKPPTIFEAVAKTRELLGDIPDVQAELAPIWEAVGERYDGNGTPKGLRGKDIPIGSRILTTAEAFTRYIKSKTGKLGKKEPEVAHIRHAFIEIGNQAGEIYDMEVVRALTNAYRKGALWPIRREPKNPDIASDEETTGNLRASSGTSIGKSTSTVASAQDTDHSTSSRRRLAEDGSTESQVPAPKK